MSTENFYGSDRAFEEFLQGGGADVPVNRSRGYLALKRLFDLGASLFGILLLLPLLPFIILLIKLETPGPIFFKQQRVGYRGRMFHCFKFRSMSIGAEDMKEDMQHLNEASGAAFKIKDDPRITGVGKFLRRSSLDEFPQLFNVFLGQMSIVGPRPQIPSEVRDYLPAHACRLLVKPGLTCLWQVSGRSHLDFQEWMELDQAYVRQAGIGMDFHILARTLPAVIERKGAY